MFLKYLPPHHRSVLLSDLSTLLFLGKETPEFLFQKTMVHYIVFVTSIFIAALPPLIPPLQVFLFYGFGSSSLFQPLLHSNGFTPPDPFSFRTKFSRRFQASSPPPFLSPLDNTFILWTPAPPPNIPFPSRSLRFFCPSGSAG